MPPSMSGPSPYAPRPLKPGQRVRREPGGPVFTVVRVNQCAAYLTSGSTHQEERKDPETGKAKTVLAADSEVLAISPMAFVYPE